jgi:alkylation response protein AidB-like acyl-CoA dehydrogenase
MEFTETSEQTMLRAAVAKIASDFGHSYLVQAVRNGTGMGELWSALSESGFVGVSIPEEHGGGGGGISDLAIVCEELAAKGVPVLMLVVSSGIGAAVIVKYGNDEQKAQWLPGLASGSSKMAFSITEPDAGLNSHKLSTTATRDGDIYRLNGTKYYASGVDEADAVLVVARTGVDEDTGRGQLSLFIVDSDAPGLERTEIPVEIIAGEKQFTLYFDNVEVPADRMVGAEGDGLRQVFAGLNPERILVAAIENGIGRYALGKGAAYANERVVWDVPIGAHQGLAHPLAKAKIEVELARLMTAKAGWLYDNGLDAGEASNIAKFAAAEAAIAALDQAIQIHGGNGMSTDYGLATMWGLCRLLRTAPVSREMILNFVAQHSLGLPRSY